MCSFELVNINSLKANETDESEIYEFKKCKIYPNRIHILSSFHIRFAGMAPTEPFLVAYL